MDIEQIRKNAPSGATHYIAYGDSVLYMMKMTFWYRHVYKNGFKDWHYCKPSLFVRLFRIKRIKNSKPL